MPKTTNFKCKVCGFETGGIVLNGMSAPEVGLRTVGCGKGNVLVSQSRDRRDDSEADWSSCSACGATDHEVWNRRCPVCDNECGSVGSDGTLHYQNLAMGTRDFSRGRKSSEKHSKQPNTKAINLLFY